VGRAPRVPVELIAGPFDLAEARRHGLTKHQLAGASWRRIAPGFYAWHEIADNPRVVLIAAQRRLPSSAVFSGRTAAWMHGLGLPPCNPVEVTLPPDSRVAHVAGISVRRADLRTHEVSTKHGLRATSVVRTVADLGRRASIVEAVAVLDAALHRRLVKLVQIKAWLESHQGFPGTARLRRAIELAEPSTESVMETRLRLILVFAGLPRPQAQVPLYDDAGRFVGRPDLYYPRQRLAIEYDGSTHRISLTADNRRQNRLINAGYGLLRFSAADVLSAPDSAVELVRQALHLPNRHA
jgi:very-short-patch-repair endonuclease